MWKSDATKGPRFKALDSWRGIAALLVAVHNFGYPHTTFVAHSSFFVDFFFVLSGFVISHAYMDRLGDRGELSVFVVRRLGRLWPLHVVMLLVFVALDFIKILAGGAGGASFHVAPFAPPNTISSIWQNLFLVQALGWHTQLSWNGPSWSISTEFWTYLLFAAIVVCCRGSAPPRWFMAAVAVVAAGLMARLSSDYLMPNNELPILRCIFGFFVGHLVLRAWRARAQPFASGGWFQILALILMLAFVRFAEGPWSMAGPLVFGFAIWAYARDDGPVSRLLVARPFVKLGTWSYSIYMVHFFIGIVVSRLLRMTGVGLSSLPDTTTVFSGVGHRWTMDAVLLGYLGIVVAVSSMTFRLIEEPARRYFRGLELHRAKARQQIG
jgi:peptidoglycan/LPS O-acetylase OafA/YrhL